MQLYVCVLIFILSGMCYSAEYMKFVADEGRSVRIDCPYPPGNEKKDKYFCRLQGISCDDLIRTATHGAWVVQGRFALFDNTRENVFILKISNLGLEDTGKYWCGVDINMLPDVINGVQILVNPKAKSQANAMAGSPVVEEPTGQMSVTGDVENRTEEVSIPGREKQSHFRFLTVITLTCVAMLLFVCVFSLVHLIRRINSCSLSVYASYNIRGTPNSSHTEDDYMRMKPGVTRVTSPVEEPPSRLQPQCPGAAVGGISVPEIDSYYLEPVAAVSSDLDPDYIDLSGPRLSSVYQNLSNESLEESVYHTIDIASS